MRNVNSPNPPARSAQLAWPDRSDSDRLATDRSAPGRLSPDRSDPGKAYTAHQTVEDVGGVRVAARLYVKSSELMDEVSPESITLTITSPPYWNAIDYDRHADDPGCSTGIRWAVYEREDPARLRTGDPVQTGGAMRRRDVTLRRYLP
jgi:hypothetical protein